MRDPRRSCPSPQRCIASCRCSISLARCSSHRQSSLLRSACRRAAILSPRVFCTRRAALQNIRSILVFATITSLRASAHSVRPSSCARRSLESQNSTSSAPLSAAVPCMLKKPSWRCALTRALASLTAAATTYRSLNASPGPMVSTLAITNPFRTALLNTGPEVSRLQRSGSQQRTHAPSQA